MAVTVTAVFLTLIGLALFGFGSQLVMLGGSFYYVLSAERTLSRKLELSRWRLCLLFDQAAQQGNTDGIQQIGRTEPVAHLFQSILDVRLVGADYHGDVRGMFAPRDQPQILPLTLREDDFMRLAIFMRRI